MADMSETTVSAGEGQAQLRRCTYCGVREDATSPDSLCNGIHADINKHKFVAKATPPAPDLREAAQDLVDWLDETGDETGSKLSIADFIRKCARLRAALAGKESQR